MVAKRKHHPLFQSARIESIAGPGVPSAVDPMGPVAAQVMSNDRLPAVAKVESR